MRCFVCVVAALLLLEGFVFAQGAPMATGRVRWGEPPAEETYSLHDTDGDGDYDVIVIDSQGRGWPLGGFGADDTIPPMSEPGLPGDRRINVVQGTNASETINEPAPAGPCVLIGYGGDDVIEGNDGFGDSAQCGDGNDTFDGKGGDDHANGGDGDDTLNGGDGDDELNGDDGKDTLNGGNDDDTLNGGKGNDTLNGDKGDDVLNGDEGHDKLNGGKGDDILDGGANPPGQPGDQDILKGGEGDDILIDTDGDPGDTLDGGDGRDMINSRDGAKDEVDLGDTGNGTDNDFDQAEVDHEDSVDHQAGNNPPAEPADDVRRG